jgi:phosphotriesterase-related protein
MRTTFHFALSLAIASLLGCNQKQEQVIMTVNGPIPASEMGMTLTHEHVLVDFIGADSTGYDRWDRTEVEEKVLPYLAEIREYQVSTLVECTPAYLGRDPLLLKSLSQKSGINIITNTGYYGARNNLYIPQKFYELTTEELARIWVDEFENGIGGSGVRPGFIKIGVDGNDTLSEEHLKIITAAALAHQKTGLVIASHTGPELPAFAQINVLKSMDIDPSGFIWVHAQLGSLGGNLKAAQMGAWISLDNVSPDREAGSLYDVAWYAERIVQLKQAGVLDRILISHDAGWYTPGEENGGTFRGFTGIFTALIPVLEVKGFTPEDIKQLLEINPRNAFSLRIIDPHSP